MLRKHKGAKRSQKMPESVLDTLSISNIARDQPTGRPMAVAEIVHRPYADGSCPEGMTLQMLPQTLLPVCVPNIAINKPSPTDPVVAQK